MVRAEYQRLTKFGRCFTLLVITRKKAQPQNSNRVNSINSLAQHEAQLDQIALVFYAPGTKS